MSDPPSYDEHLLERLNALKISSVQLSSSKPKAIFTPSQPTPESDLSARLRSLRNGSLSPSSSAQASSQSENAPVFPTIPNDDKDPLRSAIDSDDKTLDELLADLGPDDQWNLNSDDPEDIQRLLNEARDALPRNEPVTASKGPESKGDSEGSSRKIDSNVLSRDIDMSVFTLDDEGESSHRDDTSRLEDESREAHDIVARLLDEVNFEKANQTHKEDDINNEDQSDEEESSSLSLPSAPSKLPGPLAAEPTQSRKSLDFESDIVARMAALKGLGSTNELGLPAAPTFKPADKPVKGVIKKFTDEEIDDWCIICQDDATVKCFGCDGDLYCAMCWKEGHMGPDVGFEEKGHKWTKYKKAN